MPVITKTTTQIIASAYEIIGVNTPNNSPTPSQFNIGIDQLNYILSTLEIGDLGVAFYQQLTFNLVGGQAIYQFSLDEAADVTTKPFSSLEWIVYIVSNSRTPIQPISRQEFWNAPRSIITPGYPQYVVIDQQQNQTFLEFFPIPNSNYVINLSAKLLFDVAVINQTMGGMPANYYEYLEMRLAHKLSLRYPTAVWRQDHQSLLTQLAGDIKAKNSVDVSCNFTPMFNSVANCYPIRNVGP